MTKTRKKVILILACIGIVAIGIPAYSIISSELLADSFIEDPYQDITIDQYKQLESYLAQRLWYQSFLPISWEKQASLVQAAIASAGAADLPNPMNLCVIAREWRVESVYATLPDALNKVIYTKQPRASGIMCFVLDARPELTSHIDLSYVFKQSPDEMLVLTCTHVVMRQGMAKYFPDCAMMLKRKDLGIVVKVACIGYIHAYGFSKYVFNGETDLLHDLEVQEKELRATDKTGRKLVIPGVLDVLRDSNKIVQTQPDNNISSHKQVTTLPGI